MTAQAQSAPYQQLITHYENCLAQHGDSHLGVDWPNPQDAATRYQVMLDVIRPAQEKSRLLDFGCGAAHLYEYIQRQNLNYIDYAGLELSPQFLSLSQNKFPAIQFYHLDILTADEMTLPTFDYIILNGVLTEKLTMSFEEMWAYTQRLLQAVFAKARSGIAFNVMSKQVDWERRDLFHLPMDLLAGFLTRELSRHFVIRNDYGLYEYTTYVYRSPRNKVSILVPED
ncbi:MAG: class I SAM-dependent methyltransferase [Acidobacteria bacterium]|nr:class I SAM-dependent methyltransferase [Acidobacteriota bacterium]